MLVNKEENIVQCAATLACELHKGQVDKAGVDYFTGHLRETYIHRIKENALATAVKMHDLTHNMDLSRIPNPAKKDYERIERYKQEYTYLSKA